MFITLSFKILPYILEENLFQIMTNTLKLEPMLFSNVVAEKNRMFHEEYLFLSLAETLCSLYE